MKRAGFQDTLQHLADLERKGLQGSVTELSDDKQALTVERDGLNDKVSNLTGEVGQLEGEVGQLEGEVGQLEGQVGRLLGGHLELDAVLDDRAQVALADPVLAVGAAEVPGGRGPGVRDDEIGQRRSTPWLNDER